MKNKKINKVKDPKILIDATFLNKKNKKQEISKIINEKDCWFLKKNNSWILTHNAIKIIANIAGISKNYEVEESENIKPDYRNELEHIIRVTIKCNAKKKKSSKGCIHSDENTLTITGEANRINTPNRGRGYLRKMAEKRAFDIAVLEHLNLYSSVFSEEESQKFEEKKEPVLLPGSKSFEAITTEINYILSAKGIKTLKTAKKKIEAGIKINKYDDKQIKYLKELWIKEMSKKTIIF